MDVHFLQVKAYDLIPGGFRSPGKARYQLIPYQARLIHASDYQIGTFEFMKGFISGLRAGNYDISHIFIDNFHKMFNAGTEAQVVDFLDWLSSFAESEGIKFTITMTADPETVGDEIKKYAM